MVMFICLTIVSLSYLWFLLLTMNDYDNDVNAEPSELEMLNTNADSHDTENLNKINVRKRN